MIDNLLKKHPLISDQVDHRELRVILRELERTIKNTIPGSVVEFGCYQGTTSLFIQRLLQAQDNPRSFHVYDSFAGLPVKTNQDHSPAGMQFQAGELVAHKQSFIKHFK